MSSTGNITEGEDGWRLARELLTATTLMSDFPPDARPTEQDCKVWGEALDRAVATPDMAKEALTALIYHVLWSNIEKAKAQGIDEYEALADQFESMDLV